MVGFTERRPQRCRRRGRRRRPSGCICTDQIALDGSGLEEAVRAYPADPDAAPRSIDDVACACRGAANRVSAALLEANARRAHAKCRRPSGVHPHVVVLRQGVVARDIDQGEPTIAYDYVAPAAGEVPADDGAGCMGE